MRRLYWVSVPLLLVAIVAFGWVWRHQHPKHRSLVIAQTGDFFLYAPLYIAVDAKLFESRNLDVKITSTGGDEKTWAAVLAGSATFGVSDPTFVVVSGQRGQPGRVVASIVDGVPFWGVTLNAGMQPITQPSQLAGHTVATFPAPSTAYTLQEEMFRKGGLEPSIRQGAFGTLMAIVRSGAADIALELEPNVSQATTTGAKVVYSMRDMYGDFAITGLTVSPTVLHNEPELVGNVVCALQQSLVFIRERPSDSLGLLQKRFPELSPSVAKAALERVVKEDIIPPNAVVNPEAWRKAVLLRQEVGDIKNPQPMEAYVDNSYAEWAKKNCQ